ncbi:MAG: hypothetical protein ACYCPV_05950, partial [Thermoplasmata archaeon]
MPARSPRPATPDPYVPKEFRIQRSLEPGRYPLLMGFPGLDRLPIAHRIEPDEARRGRLFGETCIQIVEADLWMYVAPFELPPGRPPGWNPVVADMDCIVIGLKHLRDSPAIMLFMDIYHELCHVQQRQGGANLFDREVSYVDRWTEVEAYRVVVEEARRLGVPDDFLREYLRVEWISSAEHQRLLERLGV